MKKTRKPNGTSSIYLGKDGYWHGRVTVGVKNNGEPDRRHVQATTRPEVHEKVRVLERQRENGSVRKVGQRWTVEKWLTHWVENIAAESVSDNTLSGYRVAVRKHLIPGVGAHRLEKLEPENLETLYRQMMRQGSAAGTAHQAHRTIRTALNEAMRRGHLTRNPAALAKPPKLSDEEIEPYTVADIRALLAAASDRRNSARWAIALALGLRQSEALGLRWSDVDLIEGRLTVRRARQRPRWQHGCGNTCGRKFGGHCPKRRSAREEVKETKSRAGRRSMGLPDELIALLKKHRDEQARERERAAQLWGDGDWLFATPAGAPLNPRTDYDEWKRLLKLSGLRDGRLHDARHTAATVLLLLGVPERTVMGIMGWSSTTMAARYQHITAEVHRDIAKRVGELIWTPERQKSRKKKKSQKSQPKR
ncbi:tyrosine-type recombinase/integrase [Catenuloplanes indicus]|uniref:Integrase n=1 Tax=Catenuloplanes indicus TaxID=137267 RepID=A0AAE4AYR0_9ACTN|nr:site-specific integrase [Catenuloplanes indicus]MDQ0367579.1 integrase [Catenuloplanes indicus]